MVEQKFLSVLELEIFTKELLEANTRLGSDLISAFVERSLEMGVVKPTPINQRGEGTRAFQWAFVGVICFRQLSVWVYPKYMDSKELDLNHFRTVMRAIASLDSNTLVRDEARDLVVGDDLLSDRGAFYLRLVSLYEEHGLYGVEKSSYEINGGGEIDWPRTFALGPTFANDGNFYYTDTCTRKQNLDTANLVRQIHGALLTESRQFLERSGLGLLLGVDLPDLGGRSLDELGDTSALLHQLDRESLGQNVVWKLEVLECMRALLADDFKGAAMDSLVVLGTRTFSVFWEQACAAFFGNDLKASPRGLGFVLPNGVDIEPSSPMNSMIPAPSWELHGHIFQTSRRLRPDLIRLIPPADGTGNAWTFAIFDAKYYRIRTEIGPKGKRTLIGEPELESITKQFLYRTAFRSLIGVERIGRMVNAFLIPSQSVKVKLLGTVKFADVVESLDLPAANEISIWSLPAEKVLRALFEPVDVDSNIREIVNLV